MKKGSTPCIQYGIKAHEDICATDEKRRRGNMHVKAVGRTGETHVGVVPGDESRVTLIFDKLLVHFRSSLNV